MGQDNKYLCTGIRSCQGGFVIDSFVTAHEIRGIYFSNVPIVLVFPRENCAECLEVWKENWGHFSEKIREVFKRFVWKIRHFLAFK